MASLADTLAKYNAGGVDSAGVLAKLAEAKTKFGLSDAQLSDGLDAFARWHVNEVGRGFNKTSSDDAIVNSAVQNALNFQTDAGWKNWDLSNYSGYQVFNDAAHYADTPERIAAHRGDMATEKTRDEVLSLLRQEKSSLNPLDPTSSNFGYNLFAGYGGQQGWNDADFEKVARVVADSGKSVNDFKSALTNRGEGGSWWGPEATISYLADRLGVDPAPYIDPSKLAQEQGTAANIGQNAQAQFGGTDAFMLQGLAVVLGGALAGGALAGADVAAGATAEAGATAAAAGDAGFLTAGGVSTPATGGMFVGNSGLLGGTGNAIADAALNGAVRGGITSTLTGGDPVRGALSGGISGGFASVLPTSGIPAVDSAVRGAVSGGVGAAVNGGDVLTGAAAGGAAGGVGTLVRDAVGTELGGNTLANAAAGGAAGAVGSAIAGGDVATGLIRGAVTGGASGAATDLGADPAIAGAAGTLAGSLINSPTPDAGTPPAQQQQTSNEITSGLGFSVVLPQFQNNPRRDMQWGTRLNGG